MVQECPTAKAAFLRIFVTGTNYHSLYLSGMKQLVLSVFACLLLAGAVAATLPDSIPAHLKGLPFPDFKLELPNRSNFYTDNLPKNKPIIIMLFSPECDHCREQTKGILQSIRALGKAHIVMATVLPFDKMKAYYDEMNIARYKNITMGRDPLFFFSQYYRSHYIPFIAVYNRKRELVATYDGGVPMPTLLAQIQ